MAKRNKHHRKKINKHKILMIMKHVDDRDGEREGTREGEEDQEVELIGKTQSNSTARKATTRSIRPEYNREAINTPLSTSSPDLHHLHFPSSIS